MFRQDDWWDAEFERYLHEHMPGLPLECAPLPRPPRLTKTVTRRRDLTIVGLALQIVEWARLKEPVKLRYHTLIRVHYMYSTVVEIALK